MPLQDLVQQDAVDKTAKPNPEENSWSTRAG
jgi:hypothetical protein